MIQAQSQTYKKKDGDIIGLLAFESMDIIIKFSKQFISTSSGKLSYDNLKKGTYRAMYTDGRY